MWKGPSANWQYSAVRVNKEVDSQATVKSFQPILCGAGIYCPHQAQLGVLSVGKHAHNSSYSITDKKNHLKKSFPFLPYHCSLFNSEAFLKKLRNGNLIQTMSVPLISEVSPLSCQWFQPHAFNMTK